MLPHTNHCESLGKLQKKFTFPDAASAITVASYQYLVNIRTYQALYAVERIRSTSSNPVFAMTAIATTSCGWLHRKDSSFFDGDFTNWTTYLHSEIQVVTNLQWFIWNNSSCTGPLSPGFVIHRVRYSKCYRGSQVTTAYRSYWNMGHDGSSVIVGHGSRVMVGSE